MFIKVVKAVELKRSRNVDAQWLETLGPELEERIIGKVRPWDENDSEYVAYCDGDLFLVEVEEG